MNFNVWAAKFGSNENFFLILLKYPTYEFWGGFHGKTYPTLEFL
jgi:hypothetical protein